MFCALPRAFAFEGRISATLTRGGETQTFLYTAGTNQLRLERGETNWPHARNLINLDTGARTLVFPHNRSFVRLKPTAENSSAPPPGFPPMPTALPPGIGPQAATGLAPGAARIGPTNLPGCPSLPPMAQIPTRPAPPAGLPPGIGPQPGPGSAPPAMPAMPLMPMMPFERPELRATGEKTNLLGHGCRDWRRDMSIDCGDI